MTDRPLLVPIEEVASLLPPGSQVWTLSRLAEKVKGRFPLPQVLWPHHPGDAPAGMLAIGGGELMDAAKGWRARLNPKARLVAVPSLWGSGAEASAVVVENREDRKVISMGEEFLPDYRAVWPELMDSVDDDRIHDACGDTAAHALEAFCSPLGRDGHRDKVAVLLRLLISLPVTKDSRWFELSAQACAAQAASSVGLVHGMAHVLEGPLKANPCGERIGHARLCRTLLLPVFSYNRTHSEKTDSMFRDQGLDPVQMETFCGNLFETEFYQWLVPRIQHQWTAILRHPLTRLNSVLVRPEALRFFQEFSR